MQTMASLFHSYIHGPVDQFNYGPIIYEVILFSNLRRGVNHSLEISGNPYKKSEISYAWTKNPFEKSEISYF